MEKYQVPSCALWQGGVGDEGLRSRASRGPGPPATTQPSAGLTVTPVERCPGARSYPKEAGNPGSGQCLPLARRVTSGISKGDFLGALCLSGPQFTPL